MVTSYVRHPSLVVALVALAMGASACAVPTVREQESVATTDTVTTTVIVSSTAEQTTTTRPPTTTTRPPTTTTTTRAAAAPTVLIACPEDFDFPYGSEANVTFGYNFTLGSSSSAEFDIDYGDGKSYHSPDAGHAERNLFWHDYESPGVFTADVRMMTNLGLAASSRCTFTYGWTAPPPTTPSPIYPSPGSSGRGFDAASCTYDGIPLWGRVEIVTFLPDVRVEVVSFLPDLRVEIVDFLPSSCGRWEIVDFLPDLRVEIVTFLPDVRIEFVDFLPGT